MSGSETSQVLLYWKHPFNYNSRSFKKSYVEVSVWYYFPVIAQLILLSLFYKANF